MTEARQRVGVALDRMPLPRGDGRPLEGDRATRARSALGVDVGDVRVHDGSEAARSAADPAAGYGKATKIALWPRSADRCRQRGGIAPVEIKFWRIGRAAPGDRSIDTPASGAR